MADDVRRRLHGARTTFVRVFEVHVDAPPRGAAAAHCRPASSGSSGRPASLDAAVAAVRAARRAGGRRAAHRVLAADLQALGGASLGDVCAPPARRRPRRRRRGAVDLLADAAAAVRSRARRRPGVLRLTVHALPPERRGSRRSRARATCRRRSAGFRAFAPLPRAISVDGADDRLRRREAGRAGAAARRQHRVDPGRLAALRPEARAGRADRRRRRRRRRGGVDPGVLGHAAQPARGDPRQHPRGWPSSRSSGTGASTAGSADGAAMSDPPRRGRLSERAAARLRPRAAQPDRSRCGSTSPSKCAALLHEGAIDLGMIPVDRVSARARRTASCRASASSRMDRSRRWRCSRRRRSSEIRTIAADTSSRTSNALLRVLCVERFGIEPEFVPMAPRSGAMLRALRCRAGHRRPGAVPRSRRRSAPRRSTWASEWTAMTGLPFVWAFWAGPPGRCVADARGARWRRPATPAWPRRTQSPTAYCGPERAELGQALSEGQYPVRPGRRASTPGCGGTTSWRAGTAWSSAPARPVFYPMRRRVRRDGTAMSDRRAMMNVQRSRAGGAAADRRRRGAASSICTRRRALLGRLADEIRARKHPGARRHLHHRPQRQLHERLRGAVQLLRVLSAGRIGRGLRARLRGDLPEDRRDDRARRRAAAAAGRPQSRSAARVVRGSVPRGQGALSGVPAARAVAARGDSHLAAVAAAGAARSSSG